MEIIDPHFKKNPRPYIVQSLMALAALFVILFFVESLTQAVIVAALGASTFVVFSMPHSITAQPRRLVGGHIVGIIAGTGCQFIFYQTGLIAGDAPLVLTVFTYAASVAVAMFLMAATNTEHPPAAATALGMLIYDGALLAIPAIIIFAVALALTRRALGRYLVDLF
ncbi:MAG: HPP family protein [Dehalogenimonas sp.]|uniref:HPP family protein n=1 Tax=Candidatus Dehalogenimonas loeffleri TaxID=3127115 RepID=A0ABZ2JBB5_9CHLR|nr:HPP family protein [Dehalogenimonas sp.]